MKNKIEAAHATAAIYLEDRSKTAEEDGVGKTVLSAIGVVVVMMKFRLDVDRLCDEIEKISSKVRSDEFRYSNRISEGMMRYQLEEVNLGSCFAGLLTSKRDTSARLLNALIDDKISPKDKERLIQLSKALLRMV